MKAIRTAFWVSAILAGVSAHASIINFDDLADYTSLQDSYYDGVYFGDAYTSGFQDGYFMANSDPTYATPKSGSTYIFNAYGPDSLWFDFGVDVQFTGAWFTSAGNATSTALQVRFTDDKGDVSQWLSLTRAPQFLAANFAAAQIVTIERQGGQGDNQWYALDDVTYQQAVAPSGPPPTNPVPEPATLAILAVGAVALLRRRHVR